MLPVHRFSRAAGGRATRWLLAGVLLLWIGAVQPTYGQTRTITGTVTDASTGDTLPGVNVVVASVPNLGSATGSDGTYRLTSVPADADSLEFSFIGFETKRVAIGDRSVIDVALVPATLVTEGIVVTALGIEREEEALGYAVESVEAADLAEANEISIATTLSGRVAGLEVDQAGSGPGGSSRLVLRGSSSLTKNNQALIVLDGIPINNTQFQPAGRFGGFDFGDGITNLDPNNIASVSVLKGPSAAALYGTRGGNGVIQITTKKGEAQDGIGVSYRTKLTFETPTVWMDEDFQDEYGRGTGGSLPTDNDGTLFIPDGVESSYGPRMDGQSVRRFNGEVAPYTAQDAAESFYDTGTTLTNSVALSGGNETGTFRAAYTNVRNRGILPDHELDQNTFTLAGTYDLTDRFSATGRTTYLKRESFNRPVLSDNPDNTVQQFLFLPRSTRLQDLQPLQTPNGEPIVWNNRVPGRKQNPFWTVNLNTNDDERDRLLGMLQARYELTDWLSAQIRGGQDLYTETRRWRRATNTVFEVSTAPSRAKFQESRLKVEETNYDALLTADGQLTDDVSAELNLGANRLLQNVLIEGFTGNGASVPNLFTRNNALSVAPFVSESRREIQSIYGFGQIGFRDYAFLDFTARNDWSSTLPDGDRSFFYPSVSGSVILTDAVAALQDNSILSFAKLRASWAEAGNDASPFQIQPTFQVGGALGGSFGGNNFGTVADVLPNESVEPEITTSVEVGTDLRFLDDRANLSFTFYDQSTENQIVNIPVSSASGFSSQVINAGEVTNTGVELSVGGTPIETKDFRWDLSVNFATNDSEVQSFPGDIDTRLLGTSRSGVQLIAAEGERFGQLIGETYARNENGEILVDENGIPMRGGRDVIGNIQPDWTGGISTTLQYRGITLDALIDIQQGGDVYSLSNVIAHFNGNHENTLDGRENGLVFDGVTEDGTPNDVAVDPEAFWTDVAAFPDGAIDEAFVQDAGYVRLKQVTLGYDVPQSLLQRTPLQSLRVSAIGSNLFFLSRETSGFDPTASSRGASSFVQGLEYAAFPNTRSIGVSLSTQF